MPNETKEAFLAELRKRFGYLRKLEHSNSLYDVGNGNARIYIRYSKVHARGSAFYGLRKEDLQTLQGHPSLSTALATLKEPVTAPELAKRFARARAAEVGEILETLCAVGKARRGKGEGAFLP